MAEIKQVLGQAAKAVPSALGGLFSLGIVPIPVFGALFAFLAVHSYRGAKVARNVIGAANQLKTDQEFNPASFGPNLVRPLKGTYNNYSAFVKSMTGYDILGEYTDPAYDPHPLDPTKDLVNETNYQRELSRGLQHAENAVIDFINSGGMQYAIDLSSAENATLCIETRDSTIADIYEKMKTKGITITSPTAPPPINPTLQEAKNEFENFKYYLSNKDIDPEKCLNYFQDLQENIEKELKAQLQTDQTEINALCKSSTDPNLATEMLKTLNESHEKQLKELNDKIAADKTKLHEAVSRENARIFFLAHVYKQNPDLKPLFKALSDKAAERRAEKSNSLHSVISATTGDAKITFAGIDPKELMAHESFKTFGVKITYDKDKNECSMTLPSRLWLNESLGLEDKTKQRIVMLVKAIKATSGREKINLWVDDSDPAHAMYLARKMFEACREEGYKEEDITIVCNKKTVPLFDAEKKQDKDGKDIPGEQGMLRNETAKQAIDMKAKVYAEARKQNFDTLKNDIRRGREGEKELKTEIEEAVKARTAAAP